MDHSSGLISFLLVTNSSTPLRAFLTFFCIVYSVLLGLFGVTGLKWGKHAGHKIGKAKSRSWFRGGLSGALAGSFSLATGLQLILAAFVARSTSKVDVMSSKAFYAILLSSAVIGLAIGVRWDWLGRLLLGFASASAIPFLVAVTLHMTTLLPKIILFCLIQAVVLFSASILRLEKLSPLYSSRCLCVCSGFSGSWLFITAIDIWARLGILDALTLFVAADGLYTKSAAQPYESVVTWSATRTKGLIASAWIVGIIFGAFQLWHYTEDPDEGWDKYLSTVISAEEGLGHGMNGREGRFEPRRNLFARLFGKKRPPARRTATWPDREKLAVDNETDWLADLPKDEDESVFGTSKPPVRYDSLADDDDDSRDPFKDPFAKELAVRFKSDEVRRHGLSSKPSQASGLSGDTLVGSDQMLVRSPTEDKFTALPPPPALTKSAHNAPQPGTVRRAVRSLFGEDRAPARFPRSRTPSGQSTNSDDGKSKPQAVLAPVPATPSLIKAIERISVAQQQAKSWREKQVIEEVDEDGNDLDGLWRRIGQKAGE